MQPADLEKSIDDEFRFMFKNTPNIKKTLEGVEKFLKNEDQIYDIYQRRKFVMDFMKSVVDICKIRYRSKQYNLLNSLYRREFGENLPAYVVQRVTVTYDAVK